MFNADELPRGLGYGRMYVMVNLSPQEIAAVGVMVAVG